MPEQSVDTGAIGEIDLATAFTLPEEPEAQALTFSVEVTPFDGDDDGEVVSIGPFPILEDATQGRIVVFGGYTLNKGYDNGAYALRIRD